MRYNEGGGLLFGGFEKEAKPIFHEACPKDFENQTLQPDLDHFCKWIDSFDFTSIKKYQNTTKWFLKHK